MHNDIPASTSVFFRPRHKEKSLGQGRAIGPSALGHGPALGFFLPRTKNNLGVGAISLYIALRK